MLPLQEIAPMFYAVLVKRKVMSKFVGMNATIQPNVRSD